MSSKRGRGLHLELGGELSDDSSYSDDDRPIRRNKRSRVSDSPEDENLGRSLSSTPSFISNSHTKDDASNKIAIATARVLLGLSSRNQVLNKSLISKILEVENEKGLGLQFKKNVLPALSKIISEIFHYEVVELPSKKAIYNASSNKTQQQQQQQQDQHQSENQSNVKSTPSDEFILINNLPSSLRALNYTFMAKYTKPIKSSIKSMENSKINHSTTTIYGENLPKPTSSIIQNGFLLLILCIVILHNNNILQSDLISVLKTNFGLNFKEKEIVSIFGDQTLSDFITMLNKQDYLERNLITSSNNNLNPSSRRHLNSKAAKHDDSTLVIKLGRRCTTEWSIEEFVNLFHQLMHDQWTDQLRESAIFTVSSIWKQ
jgi:hypothetical protein